MADNSSFMKHVLNSAGLLALGVISLHAYDPQLTRQQTGRPWSISATVRGFYDDNVFTAPENSFARQFGRTVVVHPTESFGFEVSPAVRLNLPMEQTFISLGYIYSFRWYEERDPRNYDQSHEFNGKLRHQFSPRHDLGIDDSFVYTSEPTAVDRSGIVTAPLKSEGNVLHNRGSIDHNMGLSPQFAVSLGYVNNWYDYEQENTPGGFGSRSALLDRLEHLFRVDARYQFSPTIVGLVGYNFGLNTYTADEVISPARPGRPALKSDDRDSYLHRIYVGGDYDMTAKLRASLRVGGEFTDYHNSGESSVNPYADASVVYVYLPGSSVEVGIRHTRNATDIVAPDGRGNPTLDAETTVLYGQVSHRITRSFTGSLLGQFQTSEFNDGANDSRSEDLFLVGLNFDYRFNPHLAAELGYNFDILSSDVPGRGYDRNRVYIGLRASY